MLRFLLMMLASAMTGDHGVSMSESQVGQSAPALPRGVLIYRSRDGSTYFRFHFVRLTAGDIRIYILEQPVSQRGSCHVLHDSRGPYICWSQAIGSMAEAKAVTAMWAEATLVYQRTGRSF